MKLDNALYKKSFEMFELAKDNLSWEDLENILDAKNRVTPIKIKEKTADNEVFVFGSDESGIHDGRASKFAIEEFGAIKGEGEGLFGNSYAIPTTRLLKEKIGEKDREQRPVKEIAASISKFILCAKDHPDKKFLVTRIGTGFASLKPKDIAQCFRDALKLKNVFLPQQFIDILFEEEQPKHPLGWIPSSYTDVTTFRADLSNQLQKYLSWLYNFDVNKEDTSIRDLCDSVEKISQYILNAVDYTFKGLPAKAYQEIRDAMDLYRKGNGSDKKKALKLKLFPVEINHSFYRMRVEDNNWEKRKVKKEGMFHMPFTMRDKVKTQRYSMPGYPCMYLGEHVFGCWEELGRPNLNNCLVSRLENTQEFHVLDLSIPDLDKDEWNTKNESFMTRAALFPFVIACTFKSSNKDASFKCEYIIPQLLLQYVKEWSNENNGDVYGIKYTSVNIPGDRYQKTARKTPWDKSIEFYTNYVIPVTGIDGVYCSALCDLFHITDPVCEEYENMISADRKIVNKNDQKVESSTDNLYYSTRMGQIEKVLQQEDKVLGKIDSKSMNRL